MDDQPVSYGLDNQPPEYRDILCCIRCGAWFYKHDAAVLISNEARVANSPTDSIGPAKIIGYFCPKCDAVLE